MRVRQLHPWDLSPREAVALQGALASRVVRTGALEKRRVSLVAGSDVAFDRANGRGVGAVVLLSYPELDVVERATVEGPVTFPYVPGLLSFREAPLLLQAFEQLTRTPDLLMVDGHGYAHPRRFGFACHIGLLLDLPAIGVAKARLVGEHAAVAAARGSRADLCDRRDVIGSVLRTRPGVRPIFVSVGHRIALVEAERWVLACSGRYRVPEPTRLADRLAGEAKAPDARRDPRGGDRAARRRARPLGMGAGGRCRRLSPRPASDAGALRCSVDIMNPADNELLDVMLIDVETPARGERRIVRVVDVLERADGDHKLLAVPPGAPPRVSAAVRDAIWSWNLSIEKPVLGWGGEDRALDLIRLCRGVAPDSTPAAFLRLMEADRRERALSQVRPFIEKARTFSGWNFDDLGVTPVEAPRFANGRMVPWDYVGIAAERARDAGRVVDLGTGGGEVYARIIGRSAGGVHFVASEEWHVNAPVARDRLRPLGVDVVHASSERTGFAVASFGLVLSRHEAVVPDEIVRILRPGGTFVTQQVGDDQWNELSAFFPDRWSYPDHLTSYRLAFEKAGWDVETRECSWLVAYPTIGEIAFMLLVAPWEVPGFDAERDIDNLIALEDAHRGERGVVMTQARYLMIARKPG